MNKLPTNFQGSKTLFVLDAIQTRYLNKSNRHPDPSPNIPSWNVDSNKGPVRLTPGGSSPLNYNSRDNTDTNNECSCNACAPGPASFLKHLREPAHVN